MSLLSVVLPCYNEASVIGDTVSVLSRMLKEEGIQYELILIDDGSNDNTWNQIEELSESDASIKGASFSRNFGKDAAIFAGLKMAVGDCAVVIDADLQHPPNKIIEMVHLWEDGYEIVEGVKQNRGRERSVDRVSAKVFYAIMTLITGLNFADTSDYRLLDRKVINTILQMREKNFFFRGLSMWTGFQSTTVRFDVQERRAGDSKWSTRSKFRYATRNITSFSTAPMHIVTVLGIIMLIISIVMGTIALIQKFSGQALGGFTTVIILQLFSSSIIMISLGIVGYYISRIFEEVKARPLYIIQKSCNYDEHEK